MFILRKHKKSKSQERKRKFTSLMILILTMREKAYYLLKRNGINSDFIFFINLVNQSSNNYLTKTSSLSKSSANFLIPLVNFSVAIASSRKYDSIK